MFPFPVYRNVILLEGYFTSDNCCGDTESWKKLNKKGGINGEC